jgi:hypothetical protein
MGKDPREVHQVVEQVQGAPLLGAQPALDRGTARHKLLDERLAGDDRLDHKHVVPFEEPRHFIPDGRQRPVLDFDQAAVGDRVDAVVQQRHLHLGGVARIEPLQVPMERRFHTSLSRSPNAGLAPSFPVSRRFWKA